MIPREARMNACEIWTIPHETRSNTREEWRTACENCSTAQIKVSIATK